MADRAYYVYILTNRYDNVLYIGVTNDLVRRMYEHKAGYCSHSFTKRNRVDKLVYFETASCAYATISREKELKGWSRDRKIKLIEEANPDWLDLSDGL